MAEVKFPAATGGDEREVMAVVFGRDGGSVISWDKSGEVCSHDWKIDPDFKHYPDDPDDWDAPAYKCQRCGLLKQTRPSPEQP